MDGLLKEVAGTETPPDAPAAPPHVEDVEIEDDETMLPSQREKRGTYCTRRGNENDYLVLLR